jgi:hypothetical protein
MRHEIRDSNSLHFTLEVAIGGTPVTGLTPSIRIYSIKNGEYWDFSNRAWDAYNVTDSTGLMSEVEAAGLPGVYQLDATDVTLGDIPFAAISPSSSSADSADEGYVVRMEESTSGLLEYIYVVISDVMVSSTSFSGTIDANVVQWDGNNVVTADTNGVPHVNVVEWGGEDGGISSGTGGLPDVNVQDWGDIDAGAGTVAFSVGSGNLPNVDASSGGTVSADANVVDWAGLGPTLSVGSITNFPVISVGGWRDGDSGADVETALGPNSDLPSINVEAWNDSTTSVRLTSSGSALNVGLPAVTVEGWGGNSDALFTIGTVSEIPEISVKAWNTEGDGSSDDVLTQTALGDESYGNAHTVQLPAITVKGWAGDNGADISVGDSFKRPRITVTSWEGPWTNVTSELDPTSEDIAVTWTKDYMTEEDGSSGSSPVDLPNIRTQVIRNNAIDENAIQIDSVTYQEISTSAAREISDAVWSADIFKTIYNDTGTAAVAAAPVGSMAHAMIVQYLSQNMNHWNANGASPVHTCALDSSNGKFYSDRLAGVPWRLTADEQVSYIDRSVVIVKNFEFSEDNTDGMAPTINPTDVEVYLGRISGIGLDGGGQYFEVNLVNEDETIPSFSNGNDILLIKAETDSTMHEVAHEVWEEEVADHSTKHTFGMFNRIMAGLAQYNHRITDSTYDETGRLLACRLVVYPSAAAAEAGDLTGALTTVIVTSEYDEKQNMTSFMAREEGADVDPE